MELANKLANVYDQKNRSKFYTLKSLERTFNLIINIINDINFTTQIPDNIKPFLSPYQTFCDRYTFYYNQNTLQQYNQEQQLQILFCELFNVYQDYFMFTKSLNQKALEKIQAFSIQRMHTIGVVKEKIPYQNTLYSRLWEQIQKRHPNNKIISFSPTKNANDYFLKLMFSKGEDNHFCKILFDSNINNIQTYDFHFKQIVSHKCSMVLLYNSAQEIFIKNNKRITKTNKEVKEILEIKKALLTNKF